MKRPMDIWAMELTVAVWMAVPTVKMADHNRIDPLRPMLSDVNAWPRAPTKVLNGCRKRTTLMMILRNPPC